MADYPSRLRRDDVYLCLGSGQLKNQPQSNIQGPFINHHVRGYSDAGSGLLWDSWD